MCEAQLGQPLDPWLRLDQRRIGDSCQELGCHSWAPRYPGECSRARCDRHGHVEFHEDRSGSGDDAWNASIEANRQAVGRGRCNRILGLGQGALDHRCQYPCGWWIKALEEADIPMNHKVQTTHKALGLEAFHTLFNKRNCTPPEELC